MTLFYPQKDGTGDLLWVTRLLVSSGMGAAVVLGLVAIRRRDIARHRAWMTRAYALALGAGTQAFTVGFGEALFGTGVLSHDLMMAAAWVINLAVAEWVIRRPAVRRARRDRATWSVRHDLATIRRRRVVRVAASARTWTSTGRPGSTGSPSPAMTTAPPPCAAPWSTRPSCTACSPRSATSASRSSRSHPSSRPARDRRSFPVTATSLAVRSRPDERRRPTPDQFDRSSPHQEKP